MIEYLLALNQSFCHFSEKVSGMYTWTKFVCDMYNILRYSSYLYTVFSRFVLQHGGRALLADEMGLGKTLQVNNS